jgi:hypothetical protein
MRLECQEIEEYFSDYLDNTLQPDLMVQVREHLQRCSSCLDLMNEVKRTLAICEELPQLEPPPRLIEQILIKTSGKVQTLSWIEYLRDIFRPFYASPRFATGVGLAAVSVGLVLNSLGVDFSRLSQIRLSDLTPQALYRNVEHSVNLAYDNGVRRLNDLKLLYEIQQRIDELRSQTGKKAGEKDKTTVQPPQRPDNSASALEYLMAEQVFQVRSETATKPNNEESTFNKCQG